MPRGFSDFVDWSALLSDLWRHLAADIPARASFYDSFWTSQLANDELTGPRMLASS